MEIRQIRENKKQFLDLLLLADEQEDMIDRYLERGEVFALYDDDLKSIAVVTEEDENTCELKNLATRESEQGKGYGGALVRYLFSHYAPRYETMLVGTGDSPLTIPFYERLGFRYYRRVENFFIDNYDHPIFEAGKMLTDMVYLKITLSSHNS